MHDLKICRVVVCHDTGEKSEEELTCRFKIDMRNLWNIDTQKSHEFAL